MCVFFSWKTGEKTGVSGGKYYTLEPASEGITINKDGDAQAIEPGKYDVIAKIKEGYMWEITDPETGNVTYTTDDQTVTFNISDRDGFGKVYTVTFDLNGGNLDGITDKISKRFVEGTVIKMPGPVRDGYDFLYWKGSEYKAGEKYTVTEDHEFVAQWKDRSETPDDPGKKDDPVTPVDPGNDPGDTDGKTDDPGGNPDAYDSKTSQNSGANTGDNNRTVLWAVIIACSCAGLFAGILGFRRLYLRRRTKDE